MLSNLLLIAGLILASALLSNAEIAYASANELRMRRAAEISGGSPRLAYKILQNMDQAMTTMLVANNLASIASTSIATALVIDLLGNQYAWISTVIMTLLLLTFADILPKVLAKQSPELFATWLAVPLRCIMFLCKPVVIAIIALNRHMGRLWRASIDNGPSVTEDDLEVILDTVEDEGVIAEDTTDLLHSALQFDDVLAFEVITPRVDVIAIDIDDAYEEMLDTALNSSFSRLPVYEGSIDNIIGILHLNRLLKRLVSGEASCDLHSLLMPVQYVHKTMSLPDVLSTMKAQKCHMVVVNDEYGGTMGILTMEDVLEQLVGDIWDESDEIIDEFRELSPGQYEADGDMRIQDFFDELDIDDRDFDNDNATLGGWAIEMLDGVPKPGDAFAYKNVIITVERVQKRRVTRLLVDVQEPSKGDEGTEKTSGDDLT